jgi:hypothetical protein
MAMRECGIKSVAIAEHFGVSVGRANFMIRTGRKQFMRQWSEVDVKSGWFCFGRKKPKPWMGV